MEGIRATRRAVSHGALNSAYNSQARPTPRSMSRQVSRAHLQSHKEYTTLLPSPGPLESMLKTTTETGDIGAFSIRPSATFHQLPHQRSGIWDDGLRLAPGRRTELAETGGSRVHREDDRRRLPSYRDPSASDIISMYGSGSQRSGSSFRPAILDEMGPRSYSMTSSYGSRYYNQSRSHSNGYSHEASPSYLQRPRSPFPYPTRLKRPGVRPSSPALTENGNIDYTRMIGVDHVSYRTNYHRSYRQPPIYRQSSRRRPPLSLRSDINRPMRSNPSQNLYRSERASSSGAGNHEKYAHGRPLHPWPNQPSGVSAYDSTDLNARNSSFGSIIDKYRYPSPIDTGSENLHLTSEPFFYDYSEDFDYPRQESRYRSCSPLVQLSAQVTSPQRALSPSDDSVRTSKRRFASFISGSSTPHEGGDIKNNWPRYDGIPTESSLAVPPSTPLQIQDLAPQALIDPVSVTELLALQTGHVQDEGSLVMPFEADTSRLLKPTQSAKRETWCGRRTFSLGNEQWRAKPEKRSSTSCVESVSLVQQAEFSATVHRPLNIFEVSTTSAAVETSNLNNETTPIEEAPPSSPRGNPIYTKLLTNRLKSSGFHHAYTPADIVHNRCETQSLTSLDQSGGNQRTTKQSRLVNLPSSNSMIEKSRSIRTTQSPSNDCQGTPCIESDTQTLMDRHRRNQAMLRISQSSGRILLPGDSQSRSGTPILAPKPISPAKELRVRNSIPQLMKALPALPGDGHHVSSSPELLSEDSDDERRSDKMTPVIVSTLGTNRVSLPHPFDTEACIWAIPKSDVGQSSFSKIGLRLTSPVSRLSSAQHSTPLSESDFEHKVKNTGTINMEGSPALLRKGKKLKLRVVRYGSHHLNDHQNDKIRRHAESKCQNTIHQISECYPDRFEAQESITHNRTANETGPLDKRNFDETVSLTATSPLRCQTGINDGFTRGNSLDIHLKKPLLSGTTIVATTTTETHNQLSRDQAELNSDKQKGPRKHFSKMKLRLTESLTRRSGQDLAEELNSTETLEPISRPIELDEIQLLSPSREAASFMEKPQQGVMLETVRMQRKGKVRRRLSKLVKGARQTFRLYIYKRPQGVPSVV